MLNPDVVHSSMLSNPAKLFSHLTFSYIYVKKMFCNLDLVFSVNDENWKFCKSRRLRPTVLNSKNNLQQCPPNWMLPYPAKFFSTNLRRIRQLLLYLLFYDAVSRAYVYLCRHKCICLSYHLYFYMLLILLH